MKKILLIALIASFTLSAYAAPVELDYVVTEDGITYFDKINYGANAYLIGKNSDGTKVRFFKNEVLSYRKSGEVFHKKQLTIDGVPCEDCEFLKLLRTRHGFSIFLYQRNDLNGELVNTCYVYNNDKFVLEVDEENVTQMINFFMRSYK
jgi:hypothetical protein